MTVLIGQVSCFILKKSSNKSCAGSEDRPPPGKCVFGVVCFVMCVLVSCPIYVISFVISSFNASVVRDFCGTLLPESNPTIRNQEVLSRVMVVAAERISLHHRRNSGSLPWILLSRGMLHHISGSNYVVQLFHRL